MTYEPYSPITPSGSLDTVLGDVLPRLLNFLGLRSVSAVGGGLFAIYAAQWLAGALLGAGVTWGSAHATASGPPQFGLGYYSQRLRPNLTLGSTYLRAQAGDVLHMNLDADVRSGELHVHLWRLPGMNDVDVANVRKSGVTEYDVKLPETAFYCVMFSAWDARSGAEIRTATGTVVTEDLSYRLDWRLSR